MCKVEPEKDAELPFVIVASDFLGFTPPEACLPGISSNLRLLQDHAHILEAAMNGTTE